MKEKRCLSIRPLFIYTCLFGNSFPSYAFDCSKYLFFKTRPAQAFGDSFLHEQISKVYADKTLSDFHQFSLRIFYTVLKYGPHNLITQLLITNPHHTSKLPITGSSKFPNINCYSRKMQDNFHISSGISILVKMEEIHLPLSPRPVN